MFKKVKEKIKNNKVLMISLITLLIILIGGVSYAAYDYSFVGKDSSLSTGSVSIKFLESNTNVIDIKNALPTSDNDGKKDSNTFDFAVTSKASYDTSLKYTLSIEKLSVDTGYTSLNDNQIKVYLTDYNNKELVSPTLISNLSDKLLYSKTNKHSSTNTSITDKYKLRVWVDYNVDSTSWTKDTKYEYKFKIGIKSEEVEVLDKSGANAPVLDSGMIPVYYDATSETWKKADESNSNKKYQWYDYDNKMWANSVTVSSTNRSTYQKASLGTTIPMDDILTMQVWIPRYKYKVWNYNSDGTKTSNPQQIEITFEKNTDKTGEISCQDTISGTDGDPSETCKLKATNSTCTDATCNNKTYTHPAFTFGDKEIKGFWIGKFELTGTIDNITTKPDLQRLGEDFNVSNFETNIMNMSSSNNQYGISTAMDSHMIKNMEWGAVAYLSHSKYGTCTDGICKEVNVNNSFGNYTGRSGGNPYPSSSSTGTYKYNETHKNLLTITGGGTEITPTVTNDKIYPWTESDGLYKSSNQGKNSTTTNLMFNFNAPSNDTYLSFDWSVSSDESDTLSYAIFKDETKIDDQTIKGTTLGTNEKNLVYKNVVTKLEQGAYTLVILFNKDSSGSTGTDTGYIKNIKVLDGPTVKQERVAIGSGQDGPSASTTHNIYGVYDMNGGSFEYVMGNIVDNGSTNMLPGGSGFTSTTYPNIKYYDKYNYSLNDQSLIVSKLGDAIKEVSSGSSCWYDDEFAVPVSNNPWFTRGGAASNINKNNLSGLFNSYIYYGSNGYQAFTSRLIITP